MPPRFTCASGHTWESDDAGSVCPVCGAGSGPSTPPEPTGAYDPASTFPSARPTVPDAGGAPVPAGGAGLAPSGYEVLGELGRGGMGVVYKARQQGLNRLVALKTIRHAAGAGPGELARFRAEAEAVARLQHPNIVQVFEVGESGGQPYFSMEFVPGGSLADRLRDRVYPTRAAAELVVTLARAVQAAHDAGVVHRDLKPANVLLAADGTPKVTDFGLARRLDGDAGQTASGAVLGTPSYMAPEQADGHSRHAGPGADVYALGAILYELLTGRPPFKGETPVETILQVLEQPPVPPSRVRPNVESDLEAVCLRCLEKRPELRYATAAELADDLDRFLAGTTTVARPAVPPAGPLGRFFRPHKLLLRSWTRGLGFGGIVGRLVAITWVLTIFTAVVFFLGWVGVFGLGPGPLLGAFACAILYGVVVLPWLLRNWIERFCASPDADPGVLRGHDQAVHAVAFSPDGRMLATAGEDGTAKLWDAATGAARLTLGTQPSAVVGVAFTPDRRTLLTGGEDGLIRRWDPVTGREGETLYRCPNRVLGLNLSADGRLLAVLQGEPRARGRSWYKRLLAMPVFKEGTRLVLLDAATGAEVVSLTREAPAGWCAMALSPDGLTLAAVSLGERTLTLYDLSRLAGDQPPAERLVVRGKSFGPVLAFAPDGKSFVASPGATGRGTNRVSVWETATGHERTDLTAHNRLATCAAYSPDGRLIATVGRDRVVCLWDPVTGRRLAQMKGHTFPGARAVAFSPDGRTLASAGFDGAVRLWDVPTELRKARAESKG